MRSCNSFYSNEPERETKVVTTSNLGFGSVLTIAFIVLKLCGVISWNWFWVLSPLIFSICLSVLITIILIIIGLVVALRD